MNVLSLFYEQIANIMYKLSNRELIILFYLNKLKYTKIDTFVEYLVGYATLAVYIVSL